MELNWAELQAEAQRRGGESLPFNIPREAFDTLDEEAKAKHRGFLLPSRFRQWEPGMMRVTFVHPAGYCPRLRGLVPVRRRAYVLSLRYSIAGK